MSTNLEELYAALDEAMDFSNSPRDQLALCEGYRRRLSNKLRDKQAELAKARYQFRPMPDKAFPNVQDRDIFMHGRTAELQAEVDKLCDIKDILQDRVDLLKELVQNSRTATEQEEYDKAN
jgi:ClpP class serine protease